MMNYYYLLLLGLVLSSCVSKKTFQTAEADHLRSSDSLNTIVEQLRYEQDTIRDALLFERGSTHALLLTQDKLQDRLDVLQEEIDELGNNASSAQQNLSARLRQKDETIAKQQEQLADIESLLNRDEERLQQFADRVSERFDSLGIVDGWEAVINGNKLRLSINEDQLFRRNSTSTLNATGKSILGAVADTLLKFPEMEVVVIGHTDNRPVPRESLDNWQYSALRAVSVVEYLTGEGNLGSNRVIAASKSEYAPLESNETSEGRSRNRRVDLIIGTREADLQRKIRQVISRS